MNSVVEVDVEKRRDVYKKYVYFCIVYVLVCMCAFVFMHPCVCVCVCKYVLVCVCMCVFVKVHVLVLHGTYKLPLSQILREIGQPQRDGEFY